MNDETPDVDIARERLVAASTAIVAGVERLGRAFLVDRATAVLARTEVPEDARQDLSDELVRAADRATTRVVDELEALFRTPVSDQRTTPLAIVRTIVREPTAVLAAAGIEAAARDEFDARVYPDDRYSIGPADLGALGDPDLAPLHLVWGLAKAALVRSESHGRP